MSTEAPNGFRYLRVGGRGFCLGAERTSRKMLENAAREASHTSGAPKKMAGPSFCAGETAAPDMHTVYSESAGTQAVQSSGDARCRSPAVHRGFRTN